MNNWKVIPTIVLATVLIFGAGVFTGGLLVNHVKPAGGKKNVRAESSVVTNSNPVSATNATVKSSTQQPELLSKPFLLKLDEQLKLSIEQHNSVEKIIKEGQSDIKKIVRSSRLEIREVLTPEQLKQFDLLVKPPNKKPADANAPAVLPMTNSISVPPTNRP